MEKRNILIMGLIALLVIAISFSIVMTGAVSWEKLGAKVKIKPQCSDGIDNDGDDLIDYPEDLGCVDPFDNNEFNKPKLVEFVQHTTKEKVAQTVAFVEELNKEVAAPIAVALTVASVASLGTAGFSLLSYLYWYQVFI